MPSIVVVLVDRKGQPSIGAGETPIIAIALRRGDLRDNWGAVARWVAHLLHIAKDGKRP